MKKKQYISLLLAASLITNVVTLPAQATEITESAVQDEEVKKNSSESAGENLANEAKKDALEQQKTEVLTEETDISVDSDETEVVTDETDISADSEEAEVVTDETENFVDSEEAETIEEQESDVLSDENVASAETSNEDAAQQEIQQYLSMPVSENRNMTLEWWYVMTGKVAADDFSVGEDGSVSLVFPDSVSVCSARDLILLSYVASEAYASGTITLSADNGSEFDLTATVILNEDSEKETKLTYQGLGSQEHPFSGTISYSENSEKISFLLNKSLFIGLSSETKFLNQYGEKNTIYLVSKVENTFDGLFAQHVFGKNGVIADWHVSLSDPQNTDGSIYCLPSLFGTLYSMANVHLTLEDNSTQEPSANGYLCAVMQDDSTLEVAEITREITVPTVGNQSEKAAFTIQNTAEQNEEDNTQEDSQILEKASSGSLDEEEFKELVEYYRGLSVVPGEMPLEWWFAVSDRLDELKDYLEWKNTQANNSEDNIALLADSDNETGTQTYAFAEIKSADELINLSNVSAQEYQESTINITASGNAFDLTLPATDTQNTFQGLGSETYPFKGTFKYAEASENAYLTLNHALFNALSTEAAVSRVNLACAVEQSTDVDVDGLFAAKIVACDQEDTVLTTEINIKKAENLDENKTWILPAIVSSIANGAKINLTAKFPTANVPEIDANGLFCNTMEENAELTVNYPDNMPGFDTSRDNIGGLVGTMKAGAKLALEDSEKAIMINVSTTGKSAGGLVGTMVDGAKLSVDAASLTVNQVSASTEAGSYVGSLAASAVNPEFDFGKLTQISAGTGDVHLTGYIVGGMAGKMECSGDSDVSLTVLPVSELKMKGNDCGGLFGELDNGCSTVTIPDKTDSQSDSSTALTDVTFSCTASNPNTQSAGGLIGWYNPQKDQCKLVADKIKTKIKSTGFAYAGGLIGSATGSADNISRHDMELTDSDVEIASSNKDNYLGGLVGSVREKTAYLKVSGTVNNRNHNSSQVFGGLVAYADDHGDLIEVGEADLANSTITGCSGSAGGLVGKMDSGVLYMTEKPVLGSDMSGATDTRGWILGNRGNVLVCTTAKDWLTRTDDKDANDTGVWGQVLQLSKFDENLVTLDETKHTCTICALPQSGNDGYNISDISDFAAVALRMQLNEIGLLKFADDDIAAKDDVNLKIENDIDLKGTGLTGLTRDKATVYGNTTERHSISIVADENKTITLPDTLVYTVGNTNKSAHSRQGLIAEVEDLTLKNLTIKGSPQMKSLDNVARCGIVNDIYGNVTLENVTSSVNWTDIATDHSSTVSGMLTYLGNQQSKTINITNCVWNGTIKADCTKPDENSAAGFIGYGRAKEITFQNCTVAGKITKATNDIANVGGLAAVLNQVDKLDITGLTVSDTIQASNAANATGGLLGYQWKSDNTTFSGVEIKGAALDAPNARFGGLVYSGSGYWKVNEGGITFKKEKANTFNGRSVEGKTSGLILADGFWNVNGLYLEVLYDGYTIENGAVSLTKSFDYFDELVGKSINETKDGNYSGIVSIATSVSDNVSDRKIDQNGCNTYQDKTTTSPYKSLETRYYYNLDLFRNLTQSPEINTSADMVLWSAYNSCATNLRNYFKHWETKSITGTLDLKGYSFYPVPFDGTNISKATITFGFEELEDAEQSANNKKPSDTERQHAGMHTGIFTSAVNDSQNTANMELKVSDLTLAGTVGGLNNTYGAIVRGNVQGKDAEHITTLNISGVKLEGIRVYNENGYDVAPLLINSIGSFTTMNLSNVETVADQYQSEGTTTIKAASSLIGNVGGESAEEIKLNFSNMKLAESGKSEDKCNIFTHALFLESFKYSGGTCQGTYNFRQDSTAGYTLGREIQNTDSGRNQKQQYWFFGEEGEGNEIYKKLGMSGEVSTAFNNFPRYVCQTEDNTTSHELDINLPAVNLEEGCGTYSHPYVITNAGQLKALANALKGTPNEDWKVTVTEAVLDSGSFADQDGHAEQVDTDVEYQYNVAKKKWIDTNGAEIEQAKIQNYLRNAYYQITEDITLTEWSGLGGSSEDQRFRGVIVGDTENRKITIESNGGTQSQFGGLVAFSSGSVIKNLTVKYEGTVNVGLLNGTPSGTTNASFFGGVVGWCIGGDTIIDNVSVDYDAATITAGSDYTAVGGYVGLVGGASEQGGGGVVFRGNVSSTLNQSASNQYYKNPYVGRVLDGYAVSESPDVDNGSDNYPIPYLTNNADSTKTPKLNIAQGGTVNIGNAEGLWLFSAMENSRHGNAYFKGKSRSGDYSKIGQKVATSELIDEKSSYAETDFYLWKHYNVTQGIPNTALTLNINADCDMTKFGNAFRGIGVSQGSLATGAASSDGYGAKSAFLIIAQVNGNFHTITLAQDRKEHGGESSTWASMGTGLFPIMSCTDNTTISDLTLAGTTKLSAGYTFARDDLLFNTQPVRVGAGMLAGAVLNSSAKGAVSLNSVNLEKDSSVEANVPFAGGLIGYCGATFSGQKQLDNISMTNCEVNNSEVVGLTNIGGLIGYTYAKTVKVENFNGREINVGANDTYCNIKTHTTWSSGYSNGAGGVVGLIYYGEIEFDNVKLNGLSIENTNSNTIYTTDIGFGGLVGATNASKDSAGHMKNINLTGEIKITDESAHVSTGGLIGYLADTNVTNWETTDTQLSSLEISNVQIGCNSEDSVNLKGFQVGGLIGMIKDGSVKLTIGSETTAENGEKTINAVKIGKEDGSNKNIIISGNGYKGNKCLSGVIGITCNNPDITMQNLSLSGIDIKEAVYTALVLALNAKASTKLNLTNIEAYNCTVAAQKEGQKEGQSGFIYGYSNDQNKKLTVNGYNMMLKGCDIDNKAKALLGGDSKGSTIKLVAVSAVNCTGEAKDFYSASAGSYVIRANYTGTKKNTSGSNAPYVPVNPSGSGALSDKVDGLTVTGDGTAFISGETTAIGSKIAADTQEANATASQIYYNVKDAGKAYASASTSEPRILTYSEAGGNTTAGQGTSGNTSSIAQPEDFPVLLLPAVGKNEVNTAVYNYISLLTNFEFSKTSLKGKLQTNGITATTYRWDGSKFQKVTNETCSLTVGSDGTISATTGCYDNTKNQFTLLDVPFTDPTDSSNVYHLYIPVVVQKLLNYRFSAAASVGTNYYTSHYDSLKNQVLASHEEQVTTLLTFEYERKKEEWQTAIDNGENLLWDFDKKITLETDSNDNLPSGTRLTLVDRNNQNKAYYATYDGTSKTLDFKTFDGYSKDHSYLCDGLTLKATESSASEENGKVQYVKLAGSSGATLRIRNTDGSYSYYRPATATDSGTKYNIEVDGDDDEAFLLKEQFYLTIQTPKGSSSFVNIQIQCENNLKNSNGTDMIPNKRQKQENGNEYTRNNSENRIVIGDFFRETVSVTSDSDELMSESHNSIKLNVQSVIAFVNDTWADRYNQYAKGIKLYQRFDLQLKQWLSGTDSKAVNFVTGTRMDVKYYRDGKLVSGGGSETLPETAVVGLKFPEGIDFSSASQTSKSVTLNAEVTLTYDNGGINSQFIERRDSGTNTGLQFLVSSHLAYSEDALKRSSVSASGQGSKRFYRNNPQLATLNYIADGSDEHTRTNQLGVNGLVPDENKISSSATYNVKNLGELAASATELRYSVKLLRKDDNGKYTIEVSGAKKICQINNGTVTWRNSGADFSSATLGAMEGTIKLNGSLNTNDPIAFDIPLLITAGDDFENQNGIYSNYQVLLTVSLYNGNTIIQGSTVSDYIIYTNAKIVTDLIQ